MNNPSGKPTRSGGWQLASLGFELAASVGVGCLLGYWIDRRMENRHPWGLVIGGSLGIIGGLYNLVRKSVHEVLKPRSDRRPSPPEKKEDDAGS